jgi:hypothetical protein
MQGPGPPVVDRYLVAANDLQERGLLGLVIQYAVQGFGVLRTYPPLCDM